VPLQISNVNIYLLLTVKCSKICCFAEFFVDYFCDSEVHSNFGIIKG